VYRIALPKSGAGATLSETTAYAAEDRAMSEPEDPRFEPRTVARLKDDIDSGRTEDKVALFDPALAPLGTDDEAAGTPDTPDRIAMAEMSEANPVRYADPEDQGGWALYLLLGLAVTAGVLVALALFG
jgi:hypothetical protein